MSEWSAALLELENSQLVYKEETPVVSKAYSVALCGPAPFVSRVESSLKKSSLPVKTVSFTKSNKETAEKISALKPAAVMVDSSFASNGLMRFIYGRGVAIIKMNGESRNTEEFRKKGGSIEKNGDIGKFIERLCAIASVSVIWEI